jgi:hypothetical protein
LKNVGRIWLAKKANPPGMNTDDTNQEKPKPLKHGGTEAAEKSKFIADLGSGTV